MRLPAGQIQSSNRNNFKIQKFEIVGRELVIGILILFQISIFGFRI